MVSAEHRIEVSGRLDVGDPGKVADAFAQRLDFFRQTNAPGRTFAERFADLVAERDQRGESGRPPPKQVGEQLFTLAHVPDVNQLSAHFGVTSLAA